MNKKQAMSRWENSAEDKKVDAAGAKKLMGKKCPKCGKPMHAGKCKK